MCCIDGVVDGIENVYCFGGIIRGTIDVGLFIIIIIIKDMINKWNNGLLIGKKMKN